MTGPDYSTPAGHGADSLDPIEQLLRAGMLQPPRRPGLRACLDDYDIVRHAGTGGMAVVLEAIDRETQGRVAVKMIKPALRNDPYVVRHFLKEARHLEKFNHPGIVKVLRVSDREEGPYVVMPLLGFQGHTSLAHRLHRGQPLTEPEMLSILMQMARALAHAHNEGIIHRDVKPANVLFDGEGNCVLCDFGLARALDNDTISEVGRSHREGTPYYMSPKVAAGKAEDGRCDIYSLGAVLYELLTGQPPYHAPRLGTEEIIRHILEGPPEPICKLNPKASPWLTQIAERCMAREHRDRYANMEDVMADLERVEKGESPLRWRTHAHSRTVAAASVLILIPAMVWFAVQGMWRSPVKSITTSPPVVPHLELTDRIEVPGITNSWVGAKRGFWDEDKVPDFYLTQTGAWLVVSGKERRVVSEPMSPEGADTGVQVSLVADANRDGRDDAFISWTVRSKSATNAYLSAFGDRVVDGSRTPWTAFDFSQRNAPALGHGQNATALTDVRLASMDKEGLPELIAAAATGYALRPRGLYVFRPLSAAPVWEHEMAAPPASVALFDADKDGFLDMICGTGAPANGNVLPDGTDDRHCYLYALSRAKTNRLWHLQLGGVSTTCEPLLVRTKPPGEKSLFAWVQGGPIPGRKLSREPEVGMIVQIDTINRTIVTNLDTRAHMTCCLAHDLNRDGRDEIIATDGKGNVHILDLAHNSIRSTNLVTRRFTNVHLLLAGITNLSRSGPERIVLTSYEHEHVIGDAVGRDPNNPVFARCHDLKVHVLDASLQTVATHSVGDLRTNCNLRAVLLDMDGNGHSEIVTLTDFEPPRIMRLVE